RVSTCARTRSKGGGLPATITVPPTWTWIGPRSASSEDMSEADNRCVLSAIAAEPTRPRVAEVCSAYRRKALPPTRPPGPGGRAESHSSARRDRRTSHRPNEGEAMTAETVTDIRPLNVTLRAGSSAEEAYAKHAGVDSEALASGFGPRPDLDMKNYHGK